MNTRKLIAWMFFIFSPVVAFSNEYRFYEILVPEGAMSEEEREDPRQLWAAINSGRATIHSYAAVTGRTETGLSLDRTYTIVYPERRDAAGEPELAERKVGLEIKVVELEGDRVRFEYTHTAIERWIPLGSRQALQGRNQGMVVPAFSTYQLSTELSFPGRFHVFGGSRQSGVERILLIQRIAD